MTMARAEASSPRRRFTPRRVLAGAGVVALLVLGGYVGYVAAIGPDALLHPTPAADCRTPADRFGWTYEAINYWIGDDATLRAANPDMSNCVDQGAPAGPGAVTADGVSIAGWYIPAAGGTDTTTTTVVLVHGWGDNKSGLLKYASAFHDRYNVVAFDLRNGGRSGSKNTTFGIDEQQDLEAIIDWLVREKAPAHIAVMGNSMGGGTALIAAAADPRIEAVILDSTHARMAELLDRRMDVDEGLPPVPTTWALTTSIRILAGYDLDEADPVRYIAALGGRPLLVIHGTADRNDVPARSAEVLVAEAEAAGVDVELQMCQGGAHGQLVEACPDDWAAWAVSFLDRAFPP
ncbi:MAG TPA: alpha/beta fold hydrolase [Candidatus Sulfomarinibacteraceae bacterium]|nr:alpha/beta fold hydrolase [Candidatus Sulfomarinibacteraceae bacterium]